MSRAEGGKKSSVVWKYFSAPTTDTISKKQTVQCSFCKEKMIYHASTSGLRNHLARRHPLVDLKRLSDPTQTRLQSGETSAKQVRVDESFRPVSANRAEKLTKTVVNYIVSDLKPLCTVEGKEFLDLMAVVEPNFKVPSRRTITRRIEGKFEDGKASLKEKLSKVSYIALTADMWTSIKLEAFLGITAHFIEDSELKSNLLCVKPLYSRHTSENIVNWLSETAEDFEITSKIVALVTDNGSNVLKARETLEENEGWISQNCTAHALQLCLNGRLGISAIEPIMTSARKLAKHFKRSPLATSALEAKCQEMGMKFLKVIVDCPTRWGSTYDMISRLLALQSPIAAVLTDRSVTAPSVSSSLEIRLSNWEVLRELENILKSFSEAVDSLGAEKYVSISLRSTLIRGLKRQLEGQESTPMSAALWEFT